MNAEHTAALAKAKAMTRTLASAPDPHGRARSVYTDLARLGGWSKAQEAAMTAFGAWFATRPPPGELKARCQALLKQLD